MTLNIECNIKLRLDHDKPIIKDKNFETALKNTLYEALGVDFDIVVINDIKYNETEA